MNQKGQALIVLIIAVAITLSVLSAAILVAVDQVKRSARNELAKKVYYGAESGAEYALMKLLRNPNSCSGSDSLSIDGSQITINYNLNGGDCIIESEAREDNLLKKIRIQATTTNNILDYCCWQEIP